MPLATTRHCEHVLSRYSQKSRLRPSDFVYFLWPGLEWSIEKAKATLSPFSRDIISQNVPEYSMYNDTYFLNLSSGSSWWIQTELHGRRPTCGATLDGRVHAPHFVLNHGDLPGILFDFLSRNSSKIRKWSCHYPCQVTNLPVAMSRVFSPICSLSKLSHLSTVTCLGLRQSCITSSRPLEAVIRRRLPWQIVKFACRSPSFLETIYIFYVYSHGLCRSTEIKPVGCQNLK